MSGLCECGCGRETEIAPKNQASSGAVRGEPNRFIYGHQRRKSPVAFVVDPESGCWNWQRTKTSKGYGVKTLDGRKLLAHRYFYERFNGPIPEDRELDHICRNRACVNPSHLEPVTHEENLRRGRDRQAIGATT